MAEGFVVTILGESRCREDHEIRKAPPIRRRGGGQDENEHQRERDYRQRILPHLFDRGRIVWYEWKEYRLEGEEACREEETNQYVKEDFVAVHWLERNSGRDGSRVKGGFFRRKLYTRARSSGIIFC